MTARSTSVPDGILAGLFACALLSACSSPAPTSLDAGGDDGGALLDAGLLDGDGGDDAGTSECAPPDAGTVAFPSRDGGGACAADASPTPLPTGLDVPEPVITFSDRSPSSPMIVATEQEWVAFVPAITLGDGGLYRSTSMDGREWSEPVRVFDAGGFVIYEEGEYRMWYETRWGSDDVGPRTKIGFASSPDGVVWDDHGIAFAGSATLGADGLPLDDEAVGDPLVWHDGDRYHLFYTGSASRTREDLGFPIESIGHAVSDTPTGFQFVEWIHPATAGCCGGAIYSSYRLVHLVGSACSGCASGGVSLVVHGHGCEGEWHSAMLQSADGSTFTSPSRLAEHLEPGTIVTSGESSWLFSANYDTDSSVFLRSIELPATPLVCE